MSPCEVSESNLPATVFALLEEAERTAPDQPGTLPAYGTGLLGMLGGSLDFNSLNEGIPRLRTLSPRIQAFDLRMQCAANLKDLWYRLRLYHVAKLAPTTHDEFWQRYLDHGYIIPPDALRHSEKAYPPPAQWCDALRRGYGLPPDGAGNQDFPIVGEGACHYAMNPNCTADSDGDVVLLFETEAGWNQQGGTELFTFKNHNPRGGCVLLNDGAVKFIRTKGELQSLRWK